MPTLGSAYVCRRAKSAYEPLEHFFDHGACFLVRDCKFFYLLGKVIVNNQIYGFLGFRCSGLMITSARCIGYSQRFLKRGVFGVVPCSFGGRTG